MGRSRREPETALIGAVTQDGRGVAAVPGKKVFVAGALQGEEVRFRRRRSKRNFDEAELLEVLTPAAQRVAARCAAYGRCGGCVLQHVSAPQQREIKFKALQDNLQRIGGTAPAAWLPAVVGPDWNYRRRARLAVKDVAGKGRVLVGFRERHAPYITDMHRCEVLARPVDGLIDALSELIGGLSIRAQLPQIEVAVADNAVALVLRVLATPSAADRELLRGFASLHRLRIYLQTAGPDSIAPLDAGDEVAPLYYDLPDFDVRIEFDPAGFVQVNSEINQQMVSLAIDLLAPQRDDRVLDLYCGLGNFSLPLARRSGHVLGVEGDAALVAAAERNAMANGIANVEFRRADLSRIDASDGWLRQGWDRVLLDPARSGAAEIVQQMPAIGARRVVYVSCHPGTLARDAATLVREHGFTLAAAGIIDMFPHTAHVESIAVFDR